MNFDRFSVTHGRWSPNRGLRGDDILARLDHQARFTLRFANSEKGLLDKLRRILVETEGEGSGRFFQRQNFLGTPRLSQAFPQTMRVLRAAGVTMPAYGRVKNTPESMAEAGFLGRRCVPGKGKVRPPPGRHGARTRPFSAG